MRPLRVLDLFSGIGGFSYGLEKTGGFKTSAFCESDDFCKKILRKHWPSTPIYNDVRNITNDFKEEVEIICGGYPCQPFSNAGKRKGEEDDRHLWPAMFESVREFNPRWVIAENVAGHVSLGLSQVLSDLESEDFEVWPFIIPACAVGAPHRRDRVWIIAKNLDVADTERKMGGGRNCQSWRRKIFPKDGGCQGDDIHNSPDHNKRGSAQERECSRVEGEGITETCSEAWEKILRSRPRWRPEPKSPRVAHGVPDRVDRIRALGNAVVPQIVERIGAAILLDELN